MKIGYNIIEKLSVTNLKGTPHSRNIMKALLRLPERGEHTFTEVDPKDLQTDQVIYELALQDEHMSESWAYGPFTIRSVSGTEYGNTLYNPNTKNQFQGRPPFGVLTET